MNCIRCGRRTPEGSMFCEECAGTVQQPLEESAYTSTHISIPVRHPTPANAPAAPKNEKKKASPFRKRIRRLTAAVTVLAIMCTGLLGVCAYGTYSYFNDFQRERNRLRAQEEELSRREAEIEQTQEDLNAANLSLEDLQRQLSAQKLEVSRLEEEINTYKVEGSETELAINELQTDNLKLIGEKDTLSKQVEELSQDITKLNEQITALKSKNSTLQSKSDFFDKHVAFVENDGTGYYHCYDCSHFKANSYWAFSVNLAISRGYTACPYCH